MPLFIALLLLVVLGSVYDSVLFVQPVLILGLIVVQFSWGLVFGVSFECMFRVLV